MKRKKRIKKMCRKYAVFMLCAFFVIACSSKTETKQPTPFKVKQETIEVYGCEKLKKEVEEWNKTHKNKKVADC
jgi:hypothetical protein